MLNERQFLWTKTCSSVSLRKIYFFLFIVVEIKIFQVDHCTNKKYFFTLSCLGSSISFQQGTKLWTRYMNVLYQWVDLAFCFQPHTPVIARAAFILECSYYVHCFNKGQWPLWTKLNLPGFRQSGPVSCTRSSTAPNGLRRAQLLQRSAGKMFHLWAEVKFEIFQQYSTVHTLVYILCVCNWTFDEYSIRFI